MLGALEEALPGWHPLRPGVAAIRARGPARYYGGELAAALTVVGIVSELGASEARVGIADGLFAAELAAQASTPDPVRIVPSEDTADFLAPLPVAALGEPELAACSPGSASARSASSRRSTRRTWWRASVRSVRGCTRWRAGAIRDRRPRASRRATSTCRSTSSRPSTGSTRWRSGCAPASDDFVTALLAQRLVCTALRVELIGERGRVERAGVAASAVVLGGGGRRPGALAAGRRGGARSEGHFWPSATPRRGSSRPSVIGESVSAVTRVRLSPEAVDPVGAHERGLWGTGPDENVHSGALAGAGHGGAPRRARPRPRPADAPPAERQTLVPWGDRPLVARDPRQPWPGALPPPAPATVYELPRQIAVQDARGRPVAVDERGELSAPPAAMRLDRPARVAS